MEPPAANPEPPSTTPHHSHKIMWLVLLALCALAAGVVYMLLTRESQPAKVTTTQPPSTRRATPAVQLALMATGLPNPTGIVATNQSSDRRLFVLDRSGIIRIVTKDGKVLDTPFLDLSGQVLAGGEMGLLGLAFAPDYAQSGYFFINYIDKGQNTVIARYQVLKADANRADPASSQTVLALKQPYTNHNGGDLAFGPDGYLYAALGDGGSAGDPENRGQNSASLLGKLLRLDVAQLPYKVPPSNPFATQAGRAGEIWAWGLRNPWRFSFDRQTHDLYIADVGQGAFEELNFEPAGSKGGYNYGWRCYEANAAFKPDGCQAKDQFVFPVVAYDHSDGRCSVTGGYVYRGQKYPALTGKYFYGDYCNGDLYWTEKPSGNGEWPEHLALKTPYNLAVFGQDSHGELYVADFKAGALYKIVEGM